MSTIWFATSNKGKLIEVQERFSHFGVEVEQLIAPYPEIQADTLEEVVEAGLTHLWKEHARPLMIDDSGIFLDNKEGFPGVYSAYVLHTLGCQGILDLMHSDTERPAHFECCAGYIDEKGQVLVAKGRVDGHISKEEKGTTGFGFDPIFVPEGHDRTFAEMSLEEKNKMSHRSRAFDKLAEMMELEKD